MSNNRLVDLALAILREHHRAMGGRIGFDTGGRAGYGTQGRVDSPSNPAGVVTNAGGNPSTGAPLGGTGYGGTPVGQAVSDVGLSFGDGSAKVDKIPGSKDYGYSPYQSGPTDAYGASSPSSNPGAEYARSMAIALNAYNKANPQATKPVTTTSINPFGTYDPTTPYPGQMSSYDPTGINDFVPSTTPLTEGQEIDPVTGDVVEPLNTKELPTVYNTPQAKAARARKAVVQNARNVATRAPVMKPPANAGRGIRNYSPFATPSGLPQRTAAGELSHIAPSGSVVYAGDEINGVKQFYTPFGRRPEIGITPGGGKAPGVNANPGGGSRPGTISGGQYGGGVVGFTPGGNIMQGGGGVGDHSGGKNGAICTYFMKVGRVSRAEWAAAHRDYVAKPNYVMQRGYHFWAIPAVKAMRQHKWLEAVFWPLCRGHLDEVAHRREGTPRTMLGRFTAWVVEPICVALGHVVQAQDWRSLWNDKQAA